MTVISNHYATFYQIDYKTDMPVMTAINFFLVSIIFLYLKYLPAWASQILIWLVFLIGLLKIYDYIFQTDTVYVLSYYASMSMQSALSFMLFSITFLLLKRNEGITAIVMRKSIGGYYLRRILPLIFFVPMIFIILESKLENLKLIEQNFGDLITAIGTFIIIGSGLLIIARRIDLEEEKLRSAKNNIQNRDDILRLIENGKSIDDVGPKIIRLICQLYNWDLGEIWLIDEDKKVLRYVSSWHIENNDDYNEFINISNKIVFNVGEGIPGNVWLKKKHVWIPNYATQRGNAREICADNANLNSAFGFPIIFQDHIYGAMDFFSYRIQSPDEEMLSQMNNIGKLLGEFISRTHTNSQVQSFARRDILTGLLNRSAIEEDLDKVIRDTKSDIISVIIIDIDKFKMVNRALGHDTGDFIIKSAAKRINKLIDQDKKHAARLDADKFVLYYSNVKSLDEIHTYISQIEDVFKKPFYIDAKEIILTVSIGITIYPEDGVTSKDLILKSDQALENSKKEGGNKSIFFSKELSHAALDELTMHIEMYQAIKENQFELNYQPQVDLKTNKICGAEALVRWQHPSKGIVAPTEFISFAEHANLIVSLNEQIMRMVFQQINSSWQGPPISVNISAKQFQDNYHLVEYLESLIREYGVNPRHVELEVTESSDGIYQT